MMLANALTSAFGDEKGAESKTAAADPSTGADQGADAGNAGITDSLHQDAGHQDDSDFGGDGGDGGDWA
jgi:hypothetical protein